MYAVIFENIWNVIANEIYISIEMYETRFVSYRDEFRPVRKDRRIWVYVQITCSGICVLGRFDSKTPHVVVLPHRINTVRCT